MPPPRARAGAPRQPAGVVGRALPDASFPLVPRGRIVGLAFGAMRSARRGTGSDVTGTRPYVHGDPFRSIDWSASAKLSAARDADNFVLREHYADEAPRVVVVADRRPEMQLFPPGLPWLRKEEALRAAVELIRASTIEAHGFLGYLDYGDGEGEPFWLPPQSQSLWEYLDREEDGTPFQAPTSTIEDAFEFLLAHPRSVPAGTFLFVLSDFLAPPPTETWIRALEHRWDVIPVVLQDPLWERSFPPVGGFVLDVADVEGRSHEVHLTRGETRARTQAHETRWAELLETFERASLEPVLVESSDESDLLRAFLRWAELRQSGADAW